MLWSELYSLKYNRSKEWRITSLIPSFNQENIEPPKQSLPDDIESGNEADSELKEDAPTTISIESIVAYLNNFDCNNPAEN